MQPWVGKSNNDGCSCIIDTGFNGGATCSFNWMFRYEDYTGLFPHQFRTYIKALAELKFFRSRESGASHHSIIVSIWVAGGFRLVRVRLVGGDSELLLAMNIIEKLRIKVDFAHRNSHIGQGEWRAMARNGGKSMRIPPRSNFARLYEIGVVFRENENIDLEILEVPADFGYIPGVREVPASKQERVKNRMGEIENSMGNLKLTFASYLTEASNMFLQGKWRVERKCRMI